MKLYYFKDPCLNFGDDLNPWIWERLLPGFFDDDPETLFIGIGTLLNHRIPNASKRVVFGSGVGYGKRPQIDSSWDMVCVRGPRSAAALGLNQDKAVIDPAVLIHSLYNYRQVCKTYPLAFMPHCASSDDGDWEYVCKLAGIHYISPRQDVEIVMHDLASTKLLLAEAMHGAIAAEAFRIPWIALHCYEHIASFKWSDWCESINLTYSPELVKPVYRGDWHLPFNTRLRVRIKRVLKSMGTWNSNWDEPIPKRSSNREYEIAAEKLLEIARKIKPNLASEETFQSRLSKLADLLEEVKRRNLSL